MKTKYKDSIYYFLLTIAAFALMGFGGYLMSLGDILYVIFGVLSAITGYIIGLTI